MKRTSWERSEEWSILRTYSIGPVTIHIAASIGSGEYRYFVDEPPVSEEVRNLLVDVLSTLVLGPLEQGSPEDLLVGRAAEKPGIRDKLEEEMGAAIYYLRRAVSGYGPFYPLMQDPLIEEIAVEGPGIPVAVFHRMQGGGWMDTNIVLGENELDSLVQSIARKMGRHLSVARPFAEGLTPEGHRAALTFSKEISRRGSSVVVRKFPQKPFTIIDLIRSNTVSALEAAYLWTLVENKAFLLIIGGMATGKSVAGYEKLRLVGKRGLVETTFTDLWYTLIRSQRPLRLRGYEVIPLLHLGYRVRSLGQGLTQRIATPALIVKHRSPGHLYVVETSTRRVAVTGDHSLIVYRNGMMRRLKPTKALRGDKIPVTSSKGLRLEEIRRIYEERFRGDVYDLDVPGTRSFEASGIVVHNTSMLQALATLIPPNERVVTLEDTPELNLPHRHWDPLITRFSYTRDPSLSIDLEQLARFALRRRAEYLIIGEVRGSEARMLAQAAATGQGSMCLPYEEKLISRVEGSPARIPIGIIVEELLSGRKVEILSYGDNGYEWSRVRRFVVVPGPNEWVEIFLQSGRHVRLTPDHLVPVQRGNNTELVAAGLLKRGDRLLTARVDDVHRAVFGDKPHGYTDPEPIIGVRRRVTPEPAYDVELEDNHLFVHDSLLITHNCTFHADTVESAIVRLSSHPISLGESFLSLIWAVITMRRVRLRGKGMVRRASSIDEIAPGVKTRSIFSWMPSEDRHVPEDPEDVVKRSYRLRIIAGLLGISEQDVVEELSRRTEFLDILVRSGANDYRDVAKAIAGYYLGGRAWTS